MNILLYEYTGKPLKPFIGQLFDLKSTKLAMQVQLSGKAAEIVKAKVDSGEYSNAAAFISTLVLRAEEFDRIKLKRHRREVQFGLDEIKRGEVVEFDLDEIERISATALLSEQALAVDWNRPEEDEAWAHLKPKR